MQKKKIDKKKKTKTVTQFLKIALWWSIFLRYGLCPTKASQGDWWSNANHWLVQDRLPEDEDLTAAQSKDFTSVQTIPVFFFSCCNILIQDSHTRIYTMLGGGLKNR